MRSALIILATLTLAGLAADAASAQTGKISGRVLDGATGEPLPGVNVVIAGTTFGSTTDSDGYYAILRVAPGTHAVRASFIGYASMVVEDVRVRIDQTTEVDFALQEEVVQGEEVVVSAERPLVQRDLTSSSVSVSAEELEALPVLNFTDVINLQAGVVDGHFRGGRTGEVAYMVDGIPINDVYDHSFSYQVENNAIQEVQIISGTFNAEYGQAQSGIVNIVTKDGDSRFRANLSAFTGDYLTSRTSLFPNLDDVSPTGVYDVQGTLSGPLPGLSEHVTFFASGRYVDSEGYLYGNRVVLPVSANEDEGQFVEIDGRTVFVPALGDSAVVPMNWGRQGTAQMKITTRLFGGNRLSVAGLIQRDEGQNYDHLFRFNPEGIPTTYGDSWSVTGTYSQILGASSFIDFKGAYFSNSVDSYVYEDPLDPRYPADDALRRLGGNFSFYRGGARMQFFARRTRTGLGRIDFTSQVTRRHQIKTGIELKQHELFLNDFEIKNNAGTGFQPLIPDVGTPDHVQYTRRPLEASAYAQDKMEFEYLVMNVGLRFDYFDAAGEVLEDFGRPTTSGRHDSRAKWQLSPRLGIAYPLSERGVVHVAYGHFFQVPPFEFLYTNADYIYDPEEGLNRAFGFADLEPQQTVSYEIGLQQAFTDEIGVEATAYYKDIRNLLGTRIEVIQPGFDEPFPLQKYGRFVNRDYGQVRGFILAFTKRMSRGYGLNVDYTFQLARGNASDPRSVLLDEQRGTEPEKQLVPLDWDRRHQLNTSLTVGEPGNWLASVVGRLGSGLPYTPSLADERIGLENSARRPGTATFDLYASKDLTLGGLGVTVFTRIFNLLDTANEINVYTDTGRAFPNMRFQTGEPQGLNSKDDYLRRPDYYSAPRQVTIGLTIQV